MKPTRHHETEAASSDVLIDGANAMPEIAAAMAEAKSFVHVTGWALRPRPSRLCPGHRPHGEIRGSRSLSWPEGIAVRVLVWSGAPVPVFHPTRKEVTATLENLRRGTRIQAHGDPREHPFHCHHEKTVVIDGEVAFVGGIDMTDDGGDRFDTQQHHARRALGWHDVGTRLRGPAVADVAEHFRLRWHELTGETLPTVAPPPPAGTSTVQVVRTVAEDMYKAVPRGDFRIAESYLRVVSGARELIYLENQFLWAPELVSILVDKLRNPPTPDFRLVILLPAKANNGADDTQGQLGVLADADQGRLLGVTIRSMAAEGGRADPLYVHAKVGGRRRSLADRRLGQPQRPLALQRHRDVRGHRRRRTRPGHPRTALGRAPRARGVRGGGAHGGLARGRGVAADRHRAAAPPAGRRAAQPPAARAAGRLAALAAAARAAVGPGRRRLSRAGVSGRPGA